MAVVHAVRSVRCIFGPYFRENSSTSPMLLTCGSLEPSRIDNLRTVLPFICALARVQHIQVSCFLFDVFFLVARLDCRAPAPLKILITLR